VGDLCRSYPAARVIDGLSITGTSAASSTGKAVSWARRALA
jgi:hypothetical protein